jgi:hypothetical protein
MIDDQCFVSEKATMNILLRVTNVCGLCFEDIHEGDAIYYDLQEYRYLCEKCAEELSRKMNDACEIVEDGEGLF